MSLTDINKGRSGVNPSLIGSPLTSSHILVGNASNIAADVAMSGDVTIDNTGVTTIKSSVALAGNPTTTTQSSSDNSNKVATTEFVQTLVALIAAGFEFETLCGYATTTNLNATYVNGVAGVGATLTNAGSLAAFTVDGQSPALNSRILVKNQSTTTQNGIYTLTTIGSGAVAWVLTRATDYDTPAEITPGGLVPVQNGTDNANSIWLETATVTTIGTDPITFQTFINPSNVAITGGTINNTIIGGTTPAAGSFTTINSSNLTASQAVVTNGSKDLISLQYTNANTVSTLVQRDSNGDFSAGTITAALSGNASTATALQTGRTIAITGDLAYTSPSFDGTGNVTAAGTLATVNSNVGSFGSATQTGAFTVNEKGLITAASNTTVTPAVGSITGLGTGVSTALAVNTGSSGAFVVNGGALGTPSSGTLTSCTGLPVSTGISGLGTGIATALAVNVGTAGAPVINGGALGTPSSGNLSNCTGIPAVTGSVIQVVPTTKTDTFSMTSSTYADITGFSASITPSNASNKVLVIVTMQVGNSATTAAGIRLLRDSTPICIGDAASSRSRDSARVFTAAANQLNTASFSFLDSPATTSSTTYKVQMYSADNATSVYLNRSDTDTDSAVTSRTASTITLLEIKG